MRIWRMIKKAAGNLCIICGIALLAVRILDWYNPFMDFTGHSMFLLYILCICAIYMGVCSLPGKKRRVRW